MLKWASPSLPSVGQCAGAGQPFIALSHKIFICSSLHAPLHFGQKAASWVALDRAFACPRRRALPKHCPGLQSAHRVTVHATRIQVSDAWIQLRLLSFVMCKWHHCAHLVDFSPCKASSPSQPSCLTGAALYAGGYQTAPLSCWPTNNSSSIVQRTKYNKLLTQAVFDDAYGQARSKGTNLSDNSAQTQAKPGNTWVEQSNVGQELVAQPTHAHSRLTSCPNRIFDFLTPRSTCRLQDEAVSNTKQAYNVLHLTLNLPMLTSNIKAQSHKVLCRVNTEPVMTIFSGPKQHIGAKTCCLMYDANWQSG